MKTFIQGELYLAKDYSKFKAPLEKLVSEPLYQLEYLNRPMLKRRAKSEIFGDGEMTIDVNLNKIDNMSYNIDEYFVNLLEYFKRAKYIGKYGRMIKPSQDGDKDYMLNNQIILYHANDFIILYNAEYDNDKEVSPVIILNKDYTENWITIGTNTHKFENYKELYKILYMQELGLSKDNDKTKIK